MEDERVLGRIRELHAANYFAYGYRRMWKALQRAGEPVGRGQVRTSRGAARPRRFGLEGDDTCCASRSRVERVAAVPGVQFVGTADIDKKQMSIFAIGTAD